MIQRSISRFCSIAVQALIALSALVAVASPVFSQQQGMDEFAKHLAQALAKSHRKSVMVLDFTDLDGNRPELGVLLADQLSSALARSGNQFQVIDRARRNEVVDLDSIASRPIELKTFAKLIAEKTGAEAMVVGKMLPGVGNVYLDVECYQAPKGRQIAALYEFYSIPQELVLLLEKWTRISSAVPEAGKLGYGSPRCEWCPQPIYSQEAVRAHAFGVVVLRIVVTADGNVMNVRLLRGVGYGLDEEAIETVRNWKLKPATGPDGKPVATTSVVEITFKLLK